MEKSYDRHDENRRALVESLMSQLGITEAEANERLENRDWRGMNSTEAAREFEEENFGADEIGPQSHMSVPYGEDEGSADTVSETNVAPGVTPPQVIVDEEDRQRLKDNREMQEDADDKARKNDADKTKASARKAQSNKK